MKKKFLLSTGMLVLLSALAVGCGSTPAPKEEPAAKEEEKKEEPAKEEEKKEEPEKPAQESEPAEPEKPEEEENTVGMANPWVEITEEEAKNSCNRLFSAPEGATEIHWSKLEGSEKDSLVDKPLIQLDFILDELPFTARAQDGKGEGTDLVEMAGLFVEFADEGDTVLANWGMGNMPAKYYRAINDTGMVDLITWQDLEIGIGYTLSTASEDLSGFDIQAVAEAMYNPDNEPFADMPANFVVEQSGKTEFNDFDDVISCLTKGQGYAYIQLDGYDGDILAVAKEVFLADHSAAEASLFVMDGDKAKYIGDAVGNGSAYPLRCEDGILYAGDNHNYMSHYMASEYLGMMVKDIVMDGEDFGDDEYFGTLRDTHDFDHDKDFEGGKKEFEALLEEREKKKLIEFEIVK